MPNAQCPLPNAQCHHVHHRTILPQVEACAELTATGEKRFDAREFAFLVRYVRGEATPNPNPNPLTPTRTPTLTPTPTLTLTPTLTPTPTPTPTLTKTLTRYVCSEVEPAGELLRAFETFDPRGHNAVSADALVAQLINSGVPPEEIESIIRAAGVSPYPYPYSYPYPYPYPSLSPNPHLHSGPNPSPHPHPHLHPHPNQPSAHGNIHYVRLVRALYPHSGGDADELLRETGSTRGTPNPDPNP